MAPIRFTSTVKSFEFHFSPHHWQDTYIESYVMSKNQIKIIHGFFVKGLFEFDLMKDCSSTCSLNTMDVHVTSLKILSYFRSARVRTIAGLRSVQFWFKHKIKAQGFFIPDSYLHTQSIISNIEMSKWSRSNMIFKHKLVSNRLTDLISLDGSCIPDSNIHRQSTNFNIKNYNNTKGMLFICSQQKMKPFLSFF